MSDANADYAKKMLEALRESIPDREDSFREAITDICKRGVLEYEQWELGGQQGPCPIEVTPEPMLATEDDRIDSFMTAHQECADRLAELEATVRLLEAENAKLKTDLGAAWFVASERTRNGIVKWLRDMSVISEGDHFAAKVMCSHRQRIADRIAACEDIDPP